MSKKNIFVFIVLVIISLIGIYSVRAGTLEFDGVPVDITTSTNEDLIIVPGAGGNTQIGDASGTNTHAVTNDDLHVTGAIESDGAIYADSGITVGSNIVSDTDSADSLGSSTKAWLSLYTDTISTTSATDLGLSPASGSGVDYTITRSAATGNEAAVDIAATINKATSGNYTGIKLNVTETSAPGASDKLLDLQVGTVPYFQIFNSAASANYGLLSVGSDDWDGSTDGYFDGNANGTLIAANALSGYEGNLMDLQIGGTSLFNVDSDGNVTATGTLAGSGLLGGSGTAGYLSKWSAATTLDDSVIYDDGTNVGIGTTAPEKKLHISSGDVLLNNTYGYIIEDTGGFNRTLLTLNNLNHIYVGNASVNDLNLIAGTNDDIIFTNGGAETMRIDDSGNVGIGTTAPSAKLEVVGADGATIIDVTPDDGAVTKSGYIDVNSRARFGYDGAKVLISDALTNKPIVFEIGGGGTERMRLTTAGNVGIGTTNPGSALEVNGTVTATALDAATLDLNSSASLSGATSGVVLVDATYGLSIGVASITAALSVFGPGELRGIEIIGPIEQAGPLIYISQSGLASNDVMAVDSDGNGTGDLFVIDSGGNVGIGAAVPSSKLDVNGTVTATAFSTAAGTIDGHSLDADDGSPENVVYVDADGNVGIGITAPVGKLHIIETSTSVPRGIVNDQYSSNSGSPSILYRKARGTPTSPSAPIADDTLAFFGSYPYLTSDFATSATGGMGVSASQTQSNSAQGNYVSIYTTSDNSSSRTERIRINNAGNVGIGTTAPSQKLEVTIGEDVSDGILISDPDTDIAFLGDIGSTAEKGILRLYQEGVENTRITSDAAADSWIMGNVGIGTTGASAPLEVIGNTDASDAGSGTILQITTESPDTVIGANYGHLCLVNTNTTDDNWAKITFSKNADASNSAGQIANRFVDHTNNYSDLSFWTRGSGGLGERLTILNDGNVGIGKTTPEALLDVSAGDYGGAPFSYTKLLVEDDDYAMITIGTPNTKAGYLYFADPESNTGAGIYYDHSTNHMGFRSGGVEGMTFDDNRYLGIGTTNPTAKMEVYDTGETGIKLSSVVSDWRLRVDNVVDLFKITETGVGDRFVILTGGNVGIGTTAPGATLEVVSQAEDSTRENVFKFSVSDDADTLVAIYNSTVTDGLFSPTLYGYKAGDTSRPIALVGGVDTSQDSGTSPLVKLQGLLKTGDGISGTNSAVATRPILQVANFNTDLLTISANGNVGIGTTDPQGLLDVNGTIYQRGGELHADYVFEPDYELESIDDHAEYMWREKHLEAIPPKEYDSEGQEVLEIGAHRKGIVEELEKAHVYIQQLNERINVLEGEVRKLKEEK